MVKLASVVAAMAIAHGATAQEPKCKLLSIAELTVRHNHYNPVLDGEINGQKVGVLLDTGAYRSVIQRSATVRLGLPRYSLSGHQVFGVGGETQVEMAEIGEFRIGKSVRKNWRVMVVGEHDFGDDLVLGDDFFQQADIEFDLRNNAVRLYQPKDCAGVSLAYWSRQALEVALQPHERITFTVAINGKPLRAMLDSGAMSILGKIEAEERGVTPSSPGVQRWGCLRGFGVRTVESWTGTFDSFAIGDEIVRNPRIRFADLWRHATYAEAGSRLPKQLAGKPQMLLGADFLRSHRVLVARSQNKMYFTYEGGTVFDPPPARDCKAPAEKAKPG